MSRGLGDVYKRQVLIVVMIFNQSPEMIALRKRLTARFRKEGADKKDAKEKKGVA